MYQTGHAARHRNSTEIPMGVGVTVCAGRLNRENRATRIDTRHRPTILATLPDVTPTCGGRWRETTPTTNDRRGATGYAERERITHR